MEDGVGDADGVGANNYSPLRGRDNGGVGGVGAGLKPAPTGPGGNDGKGDGNYGGGGGNYGGGGADDGCEFCVGAGLKPAPTGPGGNDGKGDGNYGVGACRGEACLAPTGTDDHILIHPVPFAEEVLGVTLWSRQQEVLEALARSRRVAVKSGNGLGKDFMAAVAVLWYLHCHDPAIVLSTAPTFRQVRHVLWRQIRRLYRPAADTLGGRLLETRWELAENRYALGLSADGADQFQGFHCENVLVVVDEAEGVEEEIYDAVDAVMTSRNPRLLLIGNPTGTEGTFHRAFHQDRGIYETFTISALESPNVVAGRVEIPGLVTAEWVEERRIAWGEGSDRYRSRVLGEFPARGDDILIAMEDIEAAVYDIGMDGQDGRDFGMFLGDGDVSGGVGATGRSPLRDDPFGVFLPGGYPSPQPSPTRGEGVHGRVVIGVDVARFGSDRSVVLARRGNRVVSIQAFERIDTMATAGQVIVAAREHRPDAVNVDAIGIGAGLADRLREQGVPARAVNVAEKPRRDRTCLNLRAEGYQSLAHRFRDRRIRIPRDAELIAELATLRYEYDSRGRLLMESKDSIRRRGAPSPDKADALMLAFLDERGGDGFFMDVQDRQDEWRLGI